MDNEGIIKDLRNKYNPKNNVNLFEVKFDAPKQEQVKPSFYSYSADTQDMAYQTLNDDTQIARYESYVPGSDNSERLALNQSTGDKWINGLGKFLGKTGTAVGGGTVGTIYGITEAIKQGSFDALYDNDFSRKLDDLNVKMDYQLPNYYTKQERDKGFLSSMTDANFWANDVLSGLSFTVGAIVSEGIWAAATGGTSLASTGARWGMRTIGEAGIRSGLKSLKGTGKTLLKVGAVNVDKAITAGKIGAGVNALRFAITSTGYESGVEALHFKKEAEENFQADFEKLNGRAPNEEDYALFKENLTGAANGVFALNTALLIPSNLAMFGQNVMKNLPSPFKGVTQKLNKSLYGIGTRLEGETLKVLDPTKFQRIARKATILGKPAITEGLYEEGMQSVASNLMGKYLEASFNPKYTRNSIDMFDAVYDSMAETYGTKEGWKEIGIGMLIGGGTSLLMGQGANEFKKLDKAQKDYAEYTNTYQQMSLRQKGIMSNQTQTAITNSETALERNDRVGANLASNEAIIAQMDYKFSVGEDLADLTAEYADALNKMTAEEFKEIGVEESQIQEYKDTVISAHKSLTERYDKNRTFADLFVGSSNVIGMDTQAFAKGLAFAMTQGENSNILMGDIIENLSQKLGAENTASIQAERKLRQAGAEVTQEVYKTAEEIKALQARSAQLEKTIRRVQARPKTTGDIKGNQQAGNEYFDVAEQLIDVQAQLSEKQAQLDSLVARVNSEIGKQQGIGELNLQGNLTTDLVSSDVFLNLQENIKKTDALIESYRNTNPQAFAELAELTRQYKSAEQNFEGYQTLANQMMSGKLNFKSTNTWIGKALKKGQTLDDFTTDFFAGIRDTTERANAEFEVVDTQEEEIARDPNKPSQENKNEEKIQVLNQQLSELEAELKALENKSKTNNGKVTNVVTKPEVKSDIETKKADIEKLEKDKQEELNKDVSDRFSQVERQQAKLEPNQEAPLKIGTPYNGGMKLSATFVAIDEDAGKDGYEAIVKVIKPQINQLNEETGNIEMTQSAQVEVGVFKDKESYDKWEKNERDKTKERYKNRENRINVKYNTQIAQKQAELKALEQSTSIQTVNPRVVELEKKITDLKKEITNLGVAPTPKLSTVDQLKARIKNGLENRFRSIEYIGQTADELKIKKPTQKDVDRFQELYKTRTAEQEQEYQELRKKFADWRMVDSAYENEGETLADLVEILEQLETAQEVAQTKVETTEGDIQDITEEDKATGNIVADEIGQRSVAPATAQRTIKGEIKFSHLKIDTFLNRLGMPYEIEFPKGEKNPEAMGVKYKLSSENPITITMGEGGTILMKEKDYFANMEALNLRILRTAQEQVTWSYFDVYEWNGVETVPKTSEFEGDTLTGDSYTLPIDTPMELYLDLEHPYNKTLIEEYNKSKKEEKHKKKIMSQLVIYIRKDGKNYSTLKSLREKSTDPKMQLIREASFQAMLLGTSTVVGETKLDKIFMGTPKFSLTQEGRLNTFYFNDKSIKEVVTTGYILNGELTLADKSLTEVKRSFVSKLSTKNKESKIPVVVVKKGQYLVAYPISLSKTSASKESELDVILNSPIADVEKVKAINKLLLENQVLPSKYNLVSLDDAKIEQIREEMKNHTTTQSVDLMAEVSYKKEQLKEDATIQINLEDLNNSISSPKISIDLAGAIVKTTNDFKNSSLTDLENELSNEAIRINSLLSSRNGVVGYADKNGDPIEDKFIEVFDDNEVNKSPENQLEKMKNLNILSKAMNNLTKNARAFLGTDNVKAIQAKLKQLETVRNQLNTRPVQNNVAC